MSLNLEISTWGDQWVAECVELDLVAQAGSLNDVLYEFSRTLSVQVAIDIQNGITPLSAIRR